MPVLIFCQPSRSFLLDLSPARSNMPASRAFHTLLFQWTALQNRNGNSQRAISQGFESTRKTLIRILCRRARETLCQRSAERIGPISRTRGLLRQRASVSGEGSFAITFERG